MRGLGLGAFSVFYNWRMKNKLHNTKNLVPQLIGAHRCNYSIAPPIVRALSNWYAGFFTEEILDGNLEGTGLFLRGSQLCITFHIR